MLQQNTSLKLFRLMNVKLPIEHTCKLLQALGRHPSLKSAILTNCKLGCILEAELRRLERAILEMAQAPTALQTLVLEMMKSDVMGISEADLLVKKQIIRNLEQQLPHLQMIKI